MKKNGLVPIHARITINGKQTQFNTKLEVQEANWKSGRAVGWKIQPSLPPLIQSNLIPFVHLKLPPSN